MQKICFVMDPLMYRRSGYISGSVCSHDTSDKRESSCRDRTLRHKSTPNMTPEQWTEEEVLSGMGLDDKKNCADVYAPAYVGIKGSVLGCEK